MDDASRRNVAGDVSTELEVLTMTIDLELINMHAMCRECAKEFSALSKPSPVYRAIQKHMAEHPGHVVIGTEQTRVIFKLKGASCIVR